jgi:iron complex transport system substrate-binding protein
MPCGYEAEIAHREAEMYRAKLESLGAQRIVAVDASAFFCRPGPRLIDGLELLAHIIHPDLIGEPMDPGARAIPVDFQDTPER